MKKYVVTKQTCDKHKFALKTLFLITFIIFFPFAILSLIIDLSEKILNFVINLRNKIVYGIMKILFKKDCKIKEE